MLSEPDQTYTVMSDKHWSAAEQGVAADRFARKIVGILAVCAARSRRLMGGR